MFNNDLQCERFYRKVLMKMAATQTEHQQRPRLLKLHEQLARRNLRLAKKMWVDLKPQSLQSLESYTTEFGFSIVAGDLLYLNKGWYVTHTGLIRLSRRRHCVGIDVRPVAEFSDRAASRWAFQATVFRSMKCKGFVGYGDADPSNVSFPSTALKCAWQKPELSTARSAKPTASASVRLRKSDPSRSRRNPPESRRSFRRNRPMATETTAARRFATGFANSFASINSIPIWSRPTQPTSAGSKRFAMPPVNRSRPSYSNWLTGPRRTALPCSASSTVISARKKVPHETPNYRPARRRSLCRRPDPGRRLPGSRATSPVSSAGTEALLHTHSGHS